LWLERRHSKHAPATTPGIEQALEAWRMLQGKLDWAAYPTVCELLDVADPEQLAKDLMTINDHVRLEQGNG
jgi:hypothetical protein